MYYKRTKTMAVDSIRFEMLFSKCGGLEKSWDSKKNIDLSALPSQRVCFQEHINRVNGQVGIWTRAHCAMAKIPDS